MKNIFILFTLVFSFFFSKAFSASPESSRLSSIYISVSSSLKAPEEEETVTISFKDQNGNDFSYDPLKVRYSSSAPETLSFSDGKIIAINDGVAIIRVSYEAIVSNSLIITVKNPAIAEEPKDFCQISTSTQFSTEESDFSQKEECLNSIKNKKLVPLNAGENLISVESIKDVFSDIAIDIEPVIISVESIYLKDNINGKIYRKALENNFNAEENSSLSKKPRAFICGLLGNELCK